MYNKIDHDIRNKANLSMLDYCILDCIYQLSTSGKERYRGWCDMSKPRFSFLASERTLVNRFNKLVENGWMEFKNPEKRFLKRTTKKYYSEVRSYIDGVKKLHHEKVSPVQEFHPNHEKVSPNNNKDSNNYTNIDKVGKETTSLNKIPSDLKKGKKEKPKKVAPKKGNEKHTFPDNVPLKHYDALAKFDQRQNTQLPFDDISASKTMDLLFPKKEDALKEYNSVYSESAELEVIEKAWKTFIEKRFSNSYQQIRTVSILKKNFFEWIKNQVKYTRLNKSAKKATNYGKSSVEVENNLIDYNEDRDRKLREESRKSI